MTTSSDVALNPLSVGNHSGNDRNNHNNHPPHHHPHHHHSIDAAPAASSTCHYHHEPTTTTAVEERRESSSRPVELMSFPHQQQAAILDDTMTSLHPTPLPFSFRGGSPASGEDEDQTARKAVLERGGGTHTPPASNPKTEAPADAGLKRSPDAFSSLQQQQASTPPLAEGEDERDERDKKRQRR